MKENLQDKLVEILSAIQAATGKVSDFALSQLPDIAQSYIVFGRVTYTFYTSLAMLGMVLSIWLFFHGYKQYSKNRHNNVDPFLFFLFGVLLSIPCIAGFMVGSRSLFLVWFAPKVWLLKEIASMVK